MSRLEVLLLLLASTALFGVVARKLRIPDAIVLVLAGLGVSLVPGLPHPELDPDHVFLLVLPPLLFSQAWFTSWADFRKWLRPILLLAVGLVLFTTILVAETLHWLAPELPRAACYALGAIVSPPDAVAASAIAQAFKLPKRIVAILEGESLVNDATGLVALRFALAALVSGSFSPLEATGRFVLVSVGGVAIGLAGALLVAPIFRRVRDDAIALVLSLAVPYAVYLAAEQLHVSGVLAVVVAGMRLGERSSTILTANGRLQGFGFWSTLVFLLNGGVFLMIGLQLPGILAGVKSHSCRDVIGIAALVCAAAIVARIVWVFPGAYVPRWLSRRIRENEPKPSWRGVTIVAWSGMRGVVSMAAAMALPLELSPGVPFPGRELLIFLAFGVILGTLVLQGLSLPLLIRALGVTAGGGPGDADPEVEHERNARVIAATAALKLLRARVDDPTVDNDALRVVVADFEDRLRRLHAGSASLIGDPRGKEKLAGSVRLRRAALAASRTTLLDLHRRGDLSRELLVRVERELDMEELHWSAGSAAAE